MDRPDRHGDRHLPRSPAMHPRVPVRAHRRRPSSVRVAGAFRCDVVGARPCRRWVAGGKRLPFGLVHLLVVRSWRCTCAVVGTPVRAHVPRLAADPDGRSGGGTQHGRIAVAPVSRRIDAPPAAAYNALTDSRAVSHWRAPDGMTAAVHTFDAREGGAFRISLTYVDASRSAPGILEALRTGTDPAASRATAVPAGGVDSVS